MIRRLKKDKSCLVVKLRLMVLKFFLILMKRISKFNQVYLMFQTWKLIFRFFVPNSIEFCDFIWFYWLIRLEKHLLFYVFPSLSLRKNPETSNIRSFTFFWIETVGCRKWFSVLNLMMLTFFFQLIQCKQKSKI